MTRLLDLFGSRRFQQALVALTLLILAYYNVIPQGLANLIAGFFGVSITVGTIDKFNPEPNK